MGRNKRADHGGRTSGSEDLGVVDKEVGVLWILDEEVLGVVGLH